MPVSLKDLSGFFHSFTQGSKDAEGDGSESTSSGQEPDAMVLIIMIAVIIMTSFTLCCDAGSILPCNLKF